MGGMTAAGCLLLAYSPSAAVVLGYTTRRSALLVLTIGAAFVWLLAVLLASLVWLAIPPLKSTHGFTAAVSVLSQEAFRWLVVWAYVKAEDRVLALSTKAQAALTPATSGPAARRPAGGVAAPLPPLFNDLAAALACGAGYGAMHTVMAYGALLGTAVSNDAAWYFDGCPAVSAYVLSAATACLYSVMHMALQVVAVDAWRRMADARRAGGGAPKAAAAGRPPPASPTTVGALVLASLPVLLHLAFALATLLHATPACAASLPVLAVITACAVGAAVWVVRQPDYTASRQVRAVTAPRAVERPRGEGSAWVALPSTPSSDGGAGATASSAASSATVVRRAAASGQRASKA